MFTGIIESKGQVTGREAGEALTRITIDTGNLGSLAIGDSIAVNGVCLTAVETSPGTVTLEIIPETLSRTNLGALVEGEEVNLELPMPADGRFDGHIVQGHVDGVGTVEGITPSGDSRVVAIRAQRSLLRYLVEKGSVTVDGISLTVARVEEDVFEVAVIPHTLEVTTLGLRKPGDTVNLEVDVLAKYVERLLEAGQ
ncbi:MAG: riboflavin synthase [Acidimicrobiia bacterium]